VGRYRHMPRLGDGRKDDQGIVRTSGAAAPGVHKAAAMPSVRKRCLDSARRGVRMALICNRGRGTKVSWWFILGASV
jgi:hypothetical protein